MVADMMSSPAPASRRSARLRALIALGAAVLAASFLTPPAAFGHSSVVGSSPEGATGEPGTVEVLPGNVSVTFSDDLTEPLPADQQQGAESNTQVRVFDDSCAAVAELGADELAGLAEGAVDCRNYATGDAVVEGPTLSQELDVADAPAATYTVVWQAIYSDGHPGSGSFTFVTESAVDAQEADTAEPNAEDSPAPTAEASDAPSTETTTGADAPEDADEQGALAGPIIVAIVGGVIVLALIVFIVVMMARSRRS